jgi:hypothetical protein
MADLPALSYERLPPIGNALIDDAAGGVFIRVLPDRTLGHITSIIFAAVGFAWMCFVIANTVPTQVGLLRSIPSMVAAVLCFIVAGVMRFARRGGFMTIHATPQRIEYAAEGFSPRVIDRAKIQRVFTRDTPVSKRLTLALRLTDQTEVVIGTGDPKEIDAMAKALHRVLNADIAQPDISDAR